MRILRLNQAHLKVFWPDCSDVAVVNPSGERESNSRTKIADDSGPMRRRDRAPQGGSERTTHGYRRNFQPYRRRVDRAGKIFLNGGAVSVIGGTPTVANTAT